MNHCPVLGKRAVSCYLAEACGESPSVLYHNQRTTAYAHLAAEATQMPCLAKRMWFLVNGRSKSHVKQLQFGLICAGRKAKWWFMGWSSIRAATKPLWPPINWNRTCAPVQLEQDVEKRPQGNWLVEQDRSLPRGCQMRAVEDQRPVQGVDQRQRDDS
eukprot:CAMPEP_0117696914 /NCGR_PEP_ID=MMETSP0804-20121206/28928_1 /TAXON_ID=1074897 /ORGANISM="Tetraselmis astigmatica, Strain CCMP880" /LENGTH=157 /DNA_ID=CAMNT_0005511087 /DNA_START=1025 /DNA_END=1498 /DNA_ORIENTATION=-